MHFEHLRSRLPIRRLWRIQGAKVLCNHKENCELAPRAKQDDYMIVLKALRNALKARFLLSGIRMKKQMMFLFVMLSKIMQ